MLRTPLFALLAASGLLLGQAEPGHLPVYIEDSPAAVEQVEEARDLRAQGRLTDAVAAWQRVLEDYPGKLVPASDGLYIEVAAWARRELVRDEELLRLYREVYGPEAERALAEARQRPLDPAPLEAVERRYFLTGAGYVAGLDLAAVYLERADPAAARGLLARLAEHPDASSQGARRHQLAAIASLLLGDQEGRESHESALRGLGAGAELAEVSAMRERMRPPRRVAGERAVDLGPGEALLDRPLWRVELETDEPSPRQGGYPGASTEPPLATVPVAEGDRLYLNELMRVSAVDRYSGRPLWTYEVSPATRAAGPGMLTRMGRTMGDRRGVLVMADRVVAVVGQAMNWPGRMGGDDRGTSLAALDRETGELLWRVDPQVLDPSLERSYFQGTPVATYDRVFALVRRNQASGLQDVFLVAVDAGSGELLWRRHVSSAVTASRYATGTPPQVLLHGGTLYVGDSLAAVSAIDSRSGAVRWTRVLVTADEAGSRGLNVRGDEGELDAAPPVLTGAGLLVPPAHRGGRVSVLDPETGEDRGGFPDTPTDAIEYFLPAGGDVLAVGRQVGLLDGATLEVKWSMPVAPSSPQGVRGVAAVTNELAIVPTPDRLLLLSLADGREVREFSLQGGGNVLALDGQLVLADAETVRSYMPWEQAYAALRGRVAGEPTDPRPGLAMAHLAASMGQSEAVGEGKRAALEALRRRLDDPAAADADAVQREVFAELLALGEVGSGLDAGLREAVLGDAATISAGPEQEVAYHLALGSLLEEEGRAEEAVEHYQAILMSPALSSQLYTHRESSRQAGLEAQRRLAGVVAHHGREVYQLFEQEAARQLAEIVARGGDPVALTELAAKFPLAEAAPRALLTAGRRLAERGRPGDAVAPLRRAYARASEGGVLAEAAGRLAEAYEQQGRPRLAMQWLRRVTREHPNLRPVRDGVAVSTDAWVADLATMRGSTGAAPEMRLPLARARTVAGSLLVARPGPAMSGAADRFLVRDERTLRMHVLPELTIAWDAPLPAEDVELLALDQEHTLLWSASAGTLWAFDTATGEAVYPPIVAAHALAPLGDPTEREAERPEAERRFLEMIDVAGPVRVVEGRVVVARPPRPEGHLVHVAESVVVLVQRGGGAVGLDRHTGRALWHHAARIEQVASVEVGEDVVVLAGVRNVGTEAIGGAVQVLDLLTGEPRLPLLEDRDTPQWTGLMNVGGAAAVAVSTPDHVTAHRVSDGVVLWRLAVPGPPLTGRGWASPDLLLLEMNGGALVTIDPNRGEAVQRLELGPTDRGGLRGVTLVDGHWQIAGASGALAVGAEGGVLWRDANRTPGDPIVGQWVSERHVFLLARADEGVRQRPAQVLLGGDAEPFVVVNEEPPGVRRYRVQALNRLTGVIEYEASLTLDAAERLTVGTLVDNHALLRGADRVVVVSGATPAGE